MTLDAAIDGLYQAFSSYSRREKIEACSHCVSEEEQAELARVALRELSCEQLTSYASEAMTTWGGIEDYKHFLPRILELAATPEGDRWLGTDFQSIAWKLEYAEWRSWPKPEQVAVTDYCQALWELVLSRDPQYGSFRATELLPGITRVVKDVTPFLHAWETNGSLSSLLQLADFIDSNWAEIQNRDLKALWLDAPDREVVMRWIQDPARKESLESGFERHLDEPVADRLAAAADAWQWMQTGVR